MKNLKKRTFGSLIPKLYYLFILLLFSCSSDDGGSSRPRTSSQNRINIDLSDTKQHIVGFGGCNSVFRGAANYPEESDMQKAYGMGENELGLSIFRVSIPPNQNNWQAVANVAKDAQDRGAIVFASPWDPPADMLDPNSTENRLLPSRYADYVAHLNSFDNFMSNNGVNLHAISVQNEPDIGEWTQWTVFEIEDFMQNHAANINATVITPESFNFNRVYYQSILNNNTAVNNFDIVGGHIYGGGLGEFSLAEQKGKEIWMTEYLMNDYNNGVQATPWRDWTEQRKWNQTLEMASTVHEAMESNWNAYVWWYLKRYYSFIGDGVEGETEGEILKRGYTFSHFSKFIRPGFNRIGLEIEDGTGLKVTAYEGNGQVVAVIINDTATAASSQISIEGRTITSAKSYVTTIDENREEKSLTIENNSVFPGFIPSSITTVILEMN